MKNHIVNCKVTDCIYNDNQKCTSAGIHIGGREATDAVQTKCDTFSTKTNIFKSMSGDHTNKTAIDCKSVECKHNDNCKCNLDAISVSCTCSACSCNSVEETYCDSFDKGCCK